MWAIVLAGFFVIFQFASNRMVFGYESFPWILIFAIAYWIYFFGGAIGVNRRAALSADKTLYIIKEGVYGKVRHPIYSADIILGWAIFFSYPDVRFLLAAHWMMFVLLFWMRKEEKVLIDKFGSDYIEYMKDVPKILPNIKVILGKK